MRKVTCEEQDISVSGSIGIAGFRGNADDIKSFEDILKMADGALYKAKAKGRNCVADYVAPA